MIKRLNAVAAESNQLDSHSLFVGDLPHDLTDVGLHQHFQNLFASAISAKVRHSKLHLQSQVPFFAERSLFSL